ncbi:helix-turn-helix transcriptional regulator [Collinsella tanakaei]|uniref:Helix-turn-helix domain-containing protein n=1 Tax=Collinsella ihumii TaxID=1720204 RepID=A0ABT7XGT2_9ACTN|nr:MULTISPECIES: helix-turn-helix domain-containing protein [Collinsella]MBM6687300.1 helix-turn-helix transcriptional regulator [Collinsella tanakaei]MBM6786573.1 helix-turn-helix transcriptional regulator [Collinsella tanakaei]MCF6413548.1 helix-turn-helix transcriptional regulator [Collinsella tanakaei]MDN0064626.1 helix-turn-helix domain-containing protein [Collinsella ihumii]
MIPLSDTADLGRLIRDERKRQHMTQTELADVSGVGITYLSQLENGKETAEIGKALNVLTMLGMDLYAERRA